MGTTRCGPAVVKVTADGAGGYVLVAEVDGFFGVAREVLHETGPNVPIVAQHDVSVGVHAHHGRLGAQLNHGGALVEAYAQLHVMACRSRHLAAVAHALNAPDATASVVERHLTAVGDAVPDANGAVLAASDDDGKLGVEENTGDVFGVALQHLNACLGLIVPDADRLWGRVGNRIDLIVRARYEVWLIASGGVVNAIHAHLVLVEGEIGGSSVQTPHLNRVVERAGSERVAILRIEMHLHHIM